MTAEELRIDKAKGELHIAQGKERYILIPMRAYAAIIDAMVSLVGDAASGPLYYLGKRIGKGLVEELKSRLQKDSKEANIENLIKEYAKFLEELGFGKIDVKEFNSEHAVIYMHSPPSMAGIALVDGKAAELLQKGKKICYIEAGMIAAVFEEIIGGKFQGRELEHGTQDNPYCIIEVRKMG